jgi:hypothetical protein
MEESVASRRTPVSYIDKSREFYAAQGYVEPYRWVSNPGAPFTALAGPLSEVRVAVVTTAFAVGESLPKKVYAQDCHPSPSSMFTADLAWHKDATHTDDVGSFLPLDHLQALADDRFIGGLGPRFYGVPTEYSHRRTRADAVRIEQWVREDLVDLVLLIPL